MKMNGEQLQQLADKVGISLDGVKNLAQARTRLLNDAIFIPKK